jgi:hypothetical protein
MPELTRPTPERFGNDPSDWSNPFAGDLQAGSVRVSTAAMHDEYLPVAGETVRAIRTRYADRLGIDPNGLAILNGQPADEEAVVEAGAVLFFQRAAGEKGRAAATSKLIRYASATPPNPQVWKRFLSVVGKRKATCDRRRPLSRAS